MKDPTPNFFKIEKDVPIPEIISPGRPSPMKNAMRVMAVGDSFLIPDKRLNCLWKMARKLKIKMASRKQSNDVRRVWRIQ